MTSNKDADVIVVGAGMAGIGAAIKLRKQGLSVVVLEKGASVGGVWRENTYPGCACDVPSALYSYSFSLSSQWRHLFARQAQIESYLQSVADKFGVTPCIQFNCLATEIKYNDQHWQITTNHKTYIAPYVVVATGPMHLANTPNIDGADCFTGEQFHSSQWRHDLDLVGKRVAVIGTGASAIQFVPKIAKSAASVAVFSRTPPWVLPKADLRINKPIAALFKWVPGAQRLFRKLLFAQFERLNAQLQHAAGRAKIAAIATRQINKVIKDSALRQRLTPDYEIGCKRILQSNDWYKTLAQEHCTVMAGVAKIDQDRIEDEQGQSYQADVIIWATGFEVAEPPIAKHIFNTKNVSLASRWQGKPTAYLGTLVHDCPNLFFTFGPNLYTFSSAFEIVEAQLGLIVNAIKQSKSKQLAVSITEAQEGKFNADLQQALSSTVFNSGCDSYFLTNGYNATTWPYDVRTLKRQLSQAKMAIWAGQN